jgi:hypothetical protein
MAIVYLHKRNDTNEVFYVGIGHNEKRAYVKHKRTDYWKNIVKKYGYTVDILVSDTPWEDACKIEKLLIEKYGRKDLGLGNLVNMTDGGDGSIGVIRSEETRKKLSEARKGEKNTMFGKPGTMKGKTHSDESKQKMSEAKKGRTHSDESKQKISEAKKGDKNPNFGKPGTMLGKITSDETKQKISEAKKGIKYVKKHNIFAPEINQDEL